MKSAGSCFYCNRPMVRRWRTAVSRYASTAVTRDHVIPKSHPLYVNAVHGNMVLRCCSRCNGARGDAPALLFLLFAVQELQPAPRGTSSEVLSRFRAWMRTRCQEGRLKVAA